MEDVIKHHPLYAQVRSSTDAIDTIGSRRLGAAGAANRCGNRGGDGANSIARCRDAQNRTNAIIAQDQQEYAAKERAAMAAALRAAGQIAGRRTRWPDKSALRRRSRPRKSPRKPTRTSCSTSRASSRKTIKPPRRSLSNCRSKPIGKLRARAEQYQQSETDLSFQLSQQNASERLALKTKLSNLALDDAGRAQLESQLNALQQKQNDAELALHNRNEAALAQYRAQLRAQTDAAIAARVGNVAGPDAFPARIPAQRGRSAVCATSARRKSSRTSRPPSVNKCSRSTSDLRPRFRPTLRRR